MIHVEVEVIEHDLLILFPTVEQAMTLLFARFRGKLAPGADADAGCVPAQARLLRRFAQPEVAVVEELEFVFLVENRLVLATAFAVVAPDADVIVTIKVFEHVLELYPQHLLCPEEVGSHEVHLVAHHLATLLPLVALNAVVPGLVAYVVGADEHLLGTQLENHNKESGEE